MSTVQRWEQEEGLPVRRLQHGRGGSVFAYVHELDEWWASRGSRLPAGNETGNGANHASLAHTPAHAEEPAPPAVTWRWNTRLAFLAGTAALIVVVIGLAWRSVALGSASRAATSSPRPPATRASHRLTLSLPAEAPLAPMSAMPLASDKPALALSPDASQLVYATAGDGALRLVAYDTQAQTLRPIAGTEGGHTPFFSPDGSNLGFFARGRLWTMAIGNGAPSAIAEASNPWGAAWGSDGVIFFNRIESAGLFKVNPAVGRVENIFDVALAVMPSPLPPGHGVLANLNPGIAVIGNGAAQPKLLDGFSPRYVPSGHIVYALPGKLMAAPFDLERAVVTGPPTALAGDLRTWAYGVAQFTVSSDGTLVYVPGRDGRISRFVRVDRRGRRQSLDLGEARYGAFSLSADGSRLLVQVPTDVAAPEANLWVFNVGNSARQEQVGTQIPRPPGILHLYPKWAPDGEHLLYSEGAGSKTSLVWASVNGTERRVLWQSPGKALEWLYPMSFSPDGRLLAAFGPSSGSSMDLYVFPIRRADGTLLDQVEPVPFVHTSALEAFPQFSPDGAAIAYASDASGRYEVYVVAYPVPGTPCRVSHDSAMDPSWTDGGRELVYHSSTAIYARAVESLAACRFGPPHALFDGFPDRPGFGHAVTPDGQFLLLESDDYARPVPTLKVITNLFDELRRRVPAGATHQ